ncbi:MAG: SDR family NAD(P)-dependent oxidoreductase, partial [Gammaproteobacteria bacterium]|nr:SDR family NAD(P)-dependent oxidoreductase [Gammaproteobacteria bacterium]
MKDFNGKLAVVTGGGSGIGRELTVQLAAAGCDVAACDIFADSLAETAAMCSDAVRVTTHQCDVADEAQVLAFRDAVVQQHEAECIHLLFNNAGIGSPVAFIDGDRE